MYAIPVTILEENASELSSAALCGCPQFPCNYGQPDGSRASLPDSMVVIVVIALFEATAGFCFARTGSIGEAFNFTAVLAT